MLKVGVTLPSFGVDETAGVREHARHAEEHGLGATPGRLGRQADR